MRKIHYQHELAYAGARLIIDAREPIELHDRTASVIGGLVYAHGDCDLTVRRSAIVHAHDHTRIAVPSGERGVIIYAEDHAEVEAADGHTYANGHSRVFLAGRARAQAGDRALVVADGSSSVTIVDGAPTVRKQSVRARIDVADNLEVDRLTKVRG